MPDVLGRIPVVAGLAYIERVRLLPSSFTATLAVERDNRYFLWPLVVLASGAKVGYVAPEIARDWYAAIKAAPSPVTCPARRASVADHETSGVELLLDFTNLAIAPSE